VKRNPHPLRHSCGFALADQGADTGSFRIISGTATFSTPSSTPPPIQRGLKSSGGELLKLIENGKRHEDVANLFKVGRVCALHLKSSKAATTSPFLIDNHHIRPSTSFIEKVPTPGMAPPLC